MVEPLQNPPLLRDIECEASIPPLFPYQIEGGEWLASKAQALLADEMGLGKTAQAIRACDLTRSTKVLILCPAAARVNWLREFETFSILPRTFRIVKTRTPDLNHLDSIICSYDLAQDLNEHLKDHHFDALILDEGHFLKNHTSKRTKAVFGVAGLIRKAARCWVLSGTPAPNHAGELWPMLYTFGATPLKYEGFIKHFCNSYASPRGRGVRCITGSKVQAIPELKVLLKKIMLRRKKEDVMTQLPPITYADVVVEAGFVDIDVESSLIQWLWPVDRRKELLEQLNKERQLLEDVTGQAGFGPGGMRLLEAMAQSVSTLRRYSGLQKVEPVVELIASELENNAYEKVVIFALHRDVIEGLRVRLKAYKPVTLYGKTPPEQRQKNIDKFMREPKYRVFIGNIHAAGTAITLTAAHNVVFIEQDWVPGNNAQAAMRCHRIGQTKPVLVRFIGLAGNIDEKVSRILKQKARDLTEIFDSQ